MNKLFINISELLTMDYDLDFLRGQEMNQLNTLTDAYLIVEDGKVKEYGLMKDLEALIDHSITKVVDCKNKLVTPGLVDSHTHLVFGGSREKEIALKLQGASYLDILKMGFGIHSTVEATRQTSEYDLAKKAEKVVRRMNSFGVTTIEAKSGYGLNEETELKQLNAVDKINTASTLVKTYLGAHVIPKGMESSEHLANCKEFILKHKDEFEFVDIFTEDSVFNLEESKDFLEFAKHNGLKTKIHADEIVALGAAQMAAEIGSASADHLIATETDGIKELANSNTVCNLLPATSFYLNKPYAKAREMIDTGCIVSLSTDYNPGSSPCENIQFVMNLGLLKYKMTPAEVWNAVTVNAAYNLGVKKGSLSVGSDADIVIWDCDNHEYPLYHNAVNDVRSVYINGILIKEN